MGCVVVGQIITAQTYINPRRSKEIPVNKQQKSPVESVSVHIVFFVHITDGGVSGSANLTLLPFGLTSLLPSKLHQITPEFDYFQSTTQKIIYMSTT